MMRPFGKRSELWALEVQTPDKPGQWRYRSLHGLTSKIEKARLFGPLSVWPDPEPGEAWRALPVSELTDRFTARADELERSKGDHSKAIAYLRNMAEYWEG